MIPFTSKNYWMPRMWPLVALWSLLIFFCVSSAQDHAPVEIISQEKAVRDSLVFIGYVQGESMLSGMFRQKGFAKARNKMLDSAAKIGAQFVVLDDNQTPKYMVTSQIVSGKAYKIKSR